MFAGRKVAPGQPGLTSVTLLPPRLQAQLLDPGFQGLGQPLPSPCASAVPLLCWPFPLWSLHPVGEGCSLGLPAQAVAESPSRLRSSPAQVISLRGQRSSLGSPEGAHLFRPVGPFQDFDPHGPLPVVSRSQSTLSLRGEPGMWRLSLESQLFASSPPGPSPAGRGWASWSAGVCGVS